VSAPVTDRRQGPVLIEYEGPAASPADAPLVPDMSEPDRPSGKAMQTLARLAARRPSRLVRFFWQAGLMLLGFLASVAAWNYLEALLSASPLLGWIAVVLFAAFGLAAAGLVVRELAAFARLARIDKLQKAVRVASEQSDLAPARRVVAQLNTLYAGREDLSWARARLTEHGAQQLDVAALLTLAEAELMAPLDAAARREIEAAARSVAAVTALVPIALADVFAALAANMRMIRRVSELYGGRAGSLGSWRLARAVLTHLVATGAVAAGDDLIETIAGGGLVSKVSRRFGEGVVNGALTARVGIAAMEVCRPMPFGTLPRPSVAGLTSRALAGLFGRAKAAPAHEPPGAPQPEAQKP